MQIRYLEVLKITPLIASKEVLLEAYQKAKTGAGGDSDLIAVIELAKMEFEPIFDNHGTLLDLIVSADDLKAVLGYCSLDDGLSILNCLSLTQVSAGQFLAELSGYQDELLGTASRGVFRATFAYGSFGRCGAYLSAAGSAAQAGATFVNMVGTFVNAVGSATGITQPKSKLEGMIPSIGQLKTLLSGLPEGKVRAALMFLRTMPHFNSMLATHKQKEILKAEQKRRASFITSVASTATAICENPWQETSQLLGFDDRLPAEATLSAYVLNGAEKKLIELYDNQDVPDACEEFDEEFDEELSCHSAESGEGPLTNYGVSVEERALVSPTDRASFIELVDRFLYSLEYAVSMEKIAKETLSYQESLRLNQRLSQVRLVNQAFCQEVFKYLSRVNHRMSGVDGQEYFQEWIKRNLPFEHQIQLANALHRTISADIFKLMPKGRAEAAVERSLVSLESAKETVKLSHEIISMRGHSDYVNAIVERLDLCVKKIESQMAEPGSSVMYIEEFRQKKINFLMKLRVAFLESVHTPSPEAPLSSSLSNSDQLFWGLCNLTQYVCSLDVGRFQCYALRHITRFFTQEIITDTASLTELRALYDAFRLDYQRTLSESTYKRVINALDAGLSVNNTISLISDLQSADDEALMARRASVQERVRREASVALLVEMGGANAEDNSEDESEDITGDYLLVEGITGYTEDEHKRKFASSESLVVRK